MAAPSMRWRRRDASRACRWTWPRPRAPAMKWTCCIRTPACCHARTTATTRCPTRSGSCAASMPRSRSIRDWRARPFAPSIPGRASTTRRAAHEATSVVRMSVWKSAASCHVRRARPRATAICWELLSDRWKVAASCWSWTLSAWPTGRWPAYSCRSGSSARSMAGGCRKHSVPGIRQNSLLYMTRRGPQATYMGLPSVRRNQPLMTR